MTNRTSIAIITDKGVRYDSVLAAARAEGSSHHLIRAKIARGEYTCPDRAPVINKHNAHSAEQLMLNSALNTLMPVPRHIWDAAESEII